MDDSQDDAVLEYLISELMRIEADNELLQKANILLSRQYSEILGLYGRIQYDVSRLYELLEQDQE